MLAPLSRRALMQHLAEAGGLRIAQAQRCEDTLPSLRLGHNGPDGSHYAQGARAFATAVAADMVLSGNLRIDIHGGGELGDTLTMLRQCAAGTLDFMICSNAVVSNLVPLVGVLDAPFLFRDAAHARVALDGPLGDQLAALMPAQRLYGLAWSENGLRHITANKPIREPADLKGLKIRLVQSDVMLRGFHALGAAAGTESFSLLREALRTGRFEAEENPIVVIETERLYDLQTTLSLTGHAYDAAVFLASADVMERLAPPARQAIAACAARGAAVTRAVAAAAQRSGIRRLAAAGMAIVPDVDIAAMRRAARPYLDSLGTQFGEDLVQRLILAGT